MFVLSVEGPAFADRDLWCTHKVLGVFASRELALSHPLMAVIDADTIVILTDAATGTAERIEIQPSSGV